MLSINHQAEIEIILYCVIIKLYTNKYMYIFGCLIWDWKIVTSIEFKRALIDTFTEQNIYDIKFISYRQHQLTTIIKTNSHVAILIISYTKKLQIMCIYSSKCI